MKKEVIAITATLAELEPDDVIQFGDLHSMDGINFHTIKSDETYGNTVRKQNEPFGNDQNNWRKFYRITSYGFNKV